MATVRDFVGYGGNPPRFEWPGGARIALNIVINYEEGAELSPAEGDPQREMQAETIFPVKPTDRDLSNESAYEFGSRVGVWRVMRILDKYQATATVFAVAVALERNPDVARAFVERGYDMVGHGYRWLSPYGMDEDQERAEIRQARESIERTTGQRIVGWFPKVPQTTASRRLLAEEGFLYDCAAFNDELPYFQEVAGRRLLVVPYSLDNNDGRFWRDKLLTASHFFEYLRDGFNILYEESAIHPRMMSVGLHVRIIGRPGRAMALDQFLAHVRRHQDVWIANRNDIARFWIERFG